MRLDADRKKNSFHFDFPFLLEIQIPNPICFNYRCHRGSAYHPSLIKKGFTHNQQNTTEKDGFDEKYQSKVAFLSTFFTSATSSPSYV